MQLIAQRRLPSPLLMKLRIALLGALPFMLLGPACNKKAEPAAPPTAAGGEPGTPPGSAETGQAVVGNGGGGSSGNAGGSGNGGGSGTPGTPPAPSPGVACGPKTCAAGQVCCNASCGICTPPDGVCTQQLCNDSPGDGGAAGPPCREDGECRLFSDYCTGCDCRALLKTDKDPLCSGPGVRCLADPCRNHTAVCRDGKCQAAVAKTPRGR
jgi:hypothetical protein